MKNHPVIEAALRDWRNTNSRRNAWAAFEATNIVGDRITARLYVGYVNSAGFKEKHHVSFVYTEFQGRVHVTSIAHP